MSYDLYLFRKEEVGDDPARAYELLEAREPRIPMADEEQRLRALAADLQAANPGLDLTEPEQGFLLQLGYEAERPVVIDIGTDEIMMSWSYGRDDPEPALTEVARYLPVFERHGYVAYDPQLERPFLPGRDAPAAAEIHRNVRTRLEATYGPLDVPAGSLPWWKRISGRR